MVLEYFSYLSYSAVHFYPITKWGNPFFNDGIFLMTPLCLIPCLGILIFVGLWTCASQPTCKVCLNT